MLEGIFILFSNKRSNRLSKIHPHRLHFYHPRPSLTICSDGSIHATSPPVLGALVTTKYRFSVAIPQYFQEIFAALFVLATINSHSSSRPICGLGTFSLVFFGDERLSVIANVFLRVVHRRHRQSGWFPYDKKIFRFFTTRRSISFAHPSPQTAPGVRCLTHCLEFGVNLALTLCVLFFTAFSKRKFSSSSSEMYTEPNRSALGNNFP